MKRLLISSIACFLLAAQAPGNESKASLEIRGLKGNYPIHSRVVFDLVNPTDKAVFYGIGLEQRVEPDWREIVPNIEDIVYSPTYKYRPLAPNGTKHLVWNSRTSVPGVPASRGIYRFVIAFKKPEGGFARCYSERFSLD